MKAHITQRALLPVLLLFYIAGCATGNNAPPPSLVDLGLADRYAPAAAEPPENAATELPGTPIEALPTVAPANQKLANWWLVFDDPVLNALIERGASDNLDVQAAALDGENNHRSAKATVPPALNGVRSRVQAAIARTYVELRGRQAMIEDTRDFLVQRQALIQLAQFRAQAGLVPALDAARAVASRDDAAAHISDLEARNLQDVGQIAMLTGQTPEALGDLVAGAAHLPLGPVDVALGKPSDLLLQRADIRASAAKLAEAGTNPEARRAGLIDYKRAVLRAVQEVEVHNTAFQYAKLREIGRARAVATAEAASQAARKDYADGLADYSTVDQVAARLLATRNALRQAQVQRAVSLIGLYVALGADAGDSNDPALPLPAGAAGD